MKKITRRQGEILEFVKEQIRDNGFPPTRRDITDRFDFKSPNAAEEHLRALQRKGYIVLIRRTSRGIRLVEGEDQGFYHEDLKVIGRVAAGSPVEYYNDEREVKVTKNLFDPKADYMLQVQGESMINAGIFDGDLLAVHRTHRVFNGQIVVARIETEVTVKRYEELPAKGLIILHAENDRYPDITFRMSDEHSDLTIEGVTVGVVRLNP